MGIWTCDPLAVETFPDEDLEPETPTRLAKGEQGNGIVPFHPPPAGERTAAIAAHTATIQEWADRVIPIMQARKVRTNTAEPPPSVAHSALTGWRVMLTGAQGVGKTAAVVGARGMPGILHRATGLVSVLFVPDHGMATQAKQDYDAGASTGSPPSIVLRGRSAPDPEQSGMTMCRLSRIADDLAEAGFSVRKSLCEACPFATSCGYRRQEQIIRAMAKDPAGVVIFATHDYAFLPLPGQIGPDLAVFDERPRDMGVETATIALNTLREWATCDSVTGFPDPSACCIRQLTGALYHAGREHPHRLLAALREKGVDRVLLRQTIAALVTTRCHRPGQAVLTAIREQISAGAGSGDAELAPLLDTLPGLHRARNAANLQAIAEALLIEIEVQRDAATGILVTEIPDPAGAERKVSAICALRIRPLRVGPVPFLHLDGTGEPVIATRIFGSMEVADHRVERSSEERGDRIVQVVGATFHNAGLSGRCKSGGVAYVGAWKETYDKQRRDILKILADRPDALVVANKGVIETLKSAGCKATMAHFGTIRGRNTWEGLNRVVVLGREEPPPRAIEVIARALAARDDIPFESLGDRPYPRTVRGIRMRDGSAHPVMVSYHPNPWGDRVLRQIRDAEVVQAIDRIRPIFKEEPIKVLLLSPVVDLTVDQAIAWKDFRKGGTRIQRALDGARVIPLSSREAARLLPDIWADKRTADRDLKAAGLSGHDADISFYLQNAPVRSAVLARYRATPGPGERAREQIALIAAVPDQARAVLEKLTGPLRSLDVIQTFTKTARD